MTARERKPKSGECLGGHWDMTRRAARALGPFCLRHWNFKDSVGKFSGTTEYRITLKAIIARSTQTKYKVDDRIQGGIPDLNLIVLSQSTTHLNEIPAQIRVILNAFFFTILADRCADFAVLCLKQGTGLRNQRLNRLEW